MSNSIQLFIMLLNYETIAPQTVLFSQLRPERLCSAMASPPCARRTPNAYLIAPIVRPRTSCRDTMMLKIMTGNATSVPVAMIWPHGSS
jgi:hypothetical protein